MPRFALPPFYIKTGQELMFLSCLFYIFPAVSAQETLIPSACEIHSITCYDLAGNSSFTPFRQMIIKLMMKNKDPSISITHQFTGFSIGLACK